MFCIIKTQRMENREERLKDMEDRVKRFSILLIRVPKRKNTKTGGKRIFEEILY